jgi:hypothetical protein
MFAFAAKQITQRTLRRFRTESLKINAKCQHRRRGKNDTGMKYLSNLVLYWQGDLRYNVSNLFAQKYFFSVMCIDSSYLEMKICVYFQIHLQLDRLGRWSVIIRVDDSPHSFCEQPLRLCTVSRFRYFCKVTKISPVPCDWFPIP